jgi:ankyrin repeat protein
MCEVLIANEADLEHKDENVRSALTVAVENIAIITLLIDKGANIETTDCGGDTPLILAVNYEDYEVVEFLLKSNANVNVSNDESWTPLHKAADVENIEMCELLLNYGANFFANDRLETPLHNACNNGYLETCSLFIKHGADVNLKNKFRETPFNLACNHNHIEVCLELIKHGANSNGNDPLDNIKNYGCKILNFIENAKNLAIKALNDAYKKEAKWRRRKDFIMFLTKSKFIIKEKNYIKTSDIMIQEVILECAADYGRETTEQDMGLKEQVQLLSDENNESVSAVVNGELDEYNNQIVETYTEKVFFLKELDITIGSYL